MLMSLGKPGPIAAELLPPSTGPGGPCSHPGCLSHRTHPCEGCGRVGGGLGDKSLAEYMAPYLRLRRAADAIIEALGDRRAEIRAEITRDVVFLLQARRGKRRPHNDNWDTVEVYGTRAEAEKVGKATAYRYSNGWRVYGVPLGGKLAEALTPKRLDDLKEHEE